MKRLLSTALVVVVLLALGALAVLARSGSNILAPGDSVAAAQPQTAAAPAAGPKYNAIALPLDNGIVLASELAADITATTGATALQVLKLDPTAGWAIYDSSDPFTEDINLAVGDAVMLLMEGSVTTVYSLVGDVPDQGTVHFDLVGATPACKYNYISLPLDQSTITLASELAAEIGGVTQVLEWNPNSGYAIYDPTDPFSEDIVVKIGYPYLLCMSDSKTWPPVSP
jgi:hypothetical protein